MGHCGSAVVSNHKGKQNIATPILGTHPSLLLDDIKGFL
jgi:hypothetical protein